MDKMDKGNSQAIHPSEQAIVKKVDSLDSLPTAE
jgi:hypothetical protein